MNSAYRNIACQAGTFAISDWSIMNARECIHVDSGRAAKRGGDTKGESENYTTDVSHPFTHLHSRSALVANTKFIYP